ncbi:glutathione synthase/RimK-type ligase-like ATP-grasp enzyme [Rathayibacter tanaceti]|uniref:Glutathione synthase/RimK-type ligase-like ATP-grasp enzyme n=2 Tax=Rathayibacter tanaceti TaxID=1671680 RepID=A0ACD2XGF6_9MICO|nr:alpha-L-glutamate ligase [Rathayibacter tanaceti]QHC56759.1 alpha-L-glutamate ligase [Rathayibacter tanaceti]TCO33731.1 glutathione synthase/RimK-type ligase-like ATP-grasp enzyme [Rathayibacter tanaceti]
MTVHVLHDNPEWLPPFRRAFEQEGVELREWLLDDSATIELSEEPPAGVFWSRLSASAHTRGRPRAKETGRGLLAWAEASGHRVVNGRRALELEVSKSAQHAALKAAGIDVPRTIAVLGREQLAAAAERVGGPLILKHNQGGKGLGVRAYETPADAVDADLDDSVDGITLVQERLLPVESFVTRAEFVGGRFVYAVRVDTSAGGFELCPADACEVGSGSAHEPFELRPEITAEHPLIARLAPLLPALGIDVAGVEFIETTDGRTVVYDVNTNTNYNPAVEAVAPVSGPRSIARFVGALAREA